MKNKKMKWIVGGVIAVLLVGTAVVLANPELQQGRLVLRGLDPQPAPVEIQPDPVQVRPILPQPDIPPVQVPTVPVCVPGETIEFTNAHEFNTFFNQVNDGTLPCSRYDLKYFDNGSWANVMCDKESFTTLESDGGRVIGCTVNLENNIEVEAYIRLYTYLGMSPVLGNVVTTLGEGVSTVKDYPEVYVVSM